MGLHKLIKTRRFLDALMLTAISALPLTANAKVEPPAPNDLIIEFSDPSRETLTVTRSELLKIEGIETEPVFVPYANEAVSGKVIPLTALWNYLELESSPAVLASSYDGYFSVMKPDFIDKYAPYLLLTFDDYPEGKLQVGKSPDLGPFYLTFAAEVEKGSPELLDPDNKRPYGVNWIRIGSYEDLMEPLYSGSLSDLGKKESVGRDIYTNNCMSCHAFGETGLGGTFSNRTTTILAIHASYNMSYFKDMVKEPGKLIPDVLMPANPHYSDEQIEAVAAFILAANSNEK